jgi:general secretion pathway protein E
LYELLTVTPAFSRLIGADTDNQRLLRQGLADGMTPLRVAGAQKVLSGLTTAEEVLKVTASMNVAT